MDNFANTEFNYDRAFYRNIGWVTEAEQKIISEKTIAIAGLGGVGGIHLLTLARMGFQNFHIAEFDHFEVGNFNRQVGANMSSLHQNKLDVLMKMVLDINPNCRFKTFPEGVNDNNINDFLFGSDIYLDGIDFFCLQDRRKIFAKCSELSIPAITAGPVGMGSAYIVFMPDKMSFEEYFGLEGREEMVQYARFVAGLSPAAFHRQYFVDPSRANVPNKQGPSTMIACNLCAAVAVAEAVKILLKRGKVYAAPYYHIFDAYANRHKVGYTAFGAKNPLFILKSFLAYKFITKVR